MGAKRRFTILSLLLCLLFNGLLVGAFYYLSREIVSGLHQWVDPFLGEASADLPEDVRLSFANLSDFLRQLEQYLIPVVLGGGAALTLLLWLSLMGLGRRMIGRAFREAVPLPAPSLKLARGPSEEATLPHADTRYMQPSPGAAVQMLSILQREGRLLDFLQEDLSLYEDAQIGAAVRNIHEGCRDALRQHMELKPVFEEGEGTSVTIPSGFDARAIRLTGNVTGDPPFHGTLRHRGWRASRVQLPQPTTEEKDDWIVAPAEVEVEG